MTVGDIERDDSEGRVGRRYKVVEDRRGVSSRARNGDIIEVVSANSLNVNFKITSPTGEIRSEYWALMSGLTVEPIRSVSRVVVKGSVDTLINHRKMVAAIRGLKYSWSADLTKSLDTPLHAMVVSDGNVIEASVIIHHIGAEAFKLLIETFWNAEYYFREVNLDIVGRPYKSINDIMNGFVWSETPQGREYWGRISDKLTRIPQEEYL